MKSSKLANWAASAWLPVGFVLTIPAYLWHQNYFRSTGNYFVFIRALPLLCAIALLYAFRLRSFLRPYELPLLLLSPFVVCCAVHPVAVLSVIAIAAAALVLGDCFTPVFKFNSDDAPVVWTCGFGILILIGALLGKLGILSLPFILTVLAVGFVRAIFVRHRLRTWLSIPLATWRSAQCLNSAATGVCVFFLLLFTACSLLVVLTPVTAFDVVAYHFPLARHYAQSHSIQPVPGILESFYPQGAEVLMAMGFLLAGEPAALLLMPFLGVLFLWLLVRVGRLCAINRSAAVMGAAIAATFPFLQWTFSVAKNDSAFSLFQLAALYSFLQWQKGRGSRWLYLLAFLLGQTAGIKHVAVIGMIAMAPLCLLAWWREKCSLWVAFGTIAIFAATGLFWHAQTLSLTGNPIFPAHLVQAVNTPNQVHGNRLILAAVRYSTLPWYLLFHGQKAFESASPNPLGMFSFLLVPVAAIKLWTAQWPPARKACCCFVLIYLLYWCSILSTLRYAIVPFSLAALGLGASLVGLAELGNEMKRTAVVGLTCYCFLFSFLVFLSIAVNSSQASFLLRRSTVQQFLTEVIPAVQPLFRLATISPGSSAFGVNTCARYYAPDPLHFSCVLCEEHCLEEKILQTLEARNFQYAILPSLPEFQQLRNAVIAADNATVIDNDGKFTILRLGNALPPH